MGWVPHCGQMKWVALPVSARPQEVHRSSVIAIMNGSVKRWGAVYFLPRPRRRAATRVSHIKMAPAKATAPATYHKV